MTKDLGPYRARHPHLATFQEEWDETDQYMAHIFKDHVIHQLSETAWKCQEPGTWIYGFFVVRIPGGWTIYGDIGDVLVLRSDELSWLCGAAKSPEYFWEKVPASTKVARFMPGDALAALDNLAQELPRQAEDIYAHWCGTYIESDVLDSRQACAEAWSHGTHGDMEGFPRDRMPLEVVRCILAARWFCERMPAELPMPPWRRKETVI